MAAGIVALYLGGLSFFLFCASMKKDIFIGERAWRRYALISA